MTAAGGSDGADCIRFEIRDGARRVSCSVSSEALEAVSGLAELSTPAMRRLSFDRFRTYIHLAAMMRLQAREQGSCEPILITGRDLKRVPPQPGLPKFGTSARRPVEAKPFGAAEPYQAVA